MACGGQGRFKGQQETVCDQWGRRRRGSHVPEVDHGHETAGGERDRRAIQRGNVLANGGAYHHRGQENQTRKAKFVAANDNETTTTLTKLTFSTFQKYI